MQSLTPTTELEAVNFMLAAIGEAPVNTVEDNGVVDAAMARRTLLSTSRRIQARGWHWNTDEALVLSPSFPDLGIEVPANTLKVDTVGPSKEMDVVLRGRLLYDRRRSTYAFDEPLTCAVVSFLAFEALPETARQYIMATAARKFCETQVGNADLSTFTKRDEIQAMADLMAEEAENADYNVLPSLWSTLDRWA